MRWRTLAVAVASPILFLTACKHEQPAPAQSAPVQSVVETITVHPQAVSNQLFLAAHLMANPTSVVHIFPPISGRVVALKVLPGQEVTKGQQLGNAAEQRCGPGPVGL